MPGKENEKQQPNNDQSPPIPYRSIEIQNGAEAMKGWLRTRVDHGWRFAGACPECDHPTEKVIADEVMVLSFALARKAPKADETRGHRRHVVECDCGVAHPGRPDDGVGCGARWGVLIQESEPDEGAGNP